MGHKCQPSALRGKWASQIAGGHLSKGDMVALERGGGGFSHGGPGVVFPAWSHQAVWERSHPHTELTSAVRECENAQQPSYSWKRLNS